MKQDDIIKLAREAGLQPYYDEQEPAIERFANLVAEHEREACEMAVEEIARKYQKAHEASLENIADECAAAIRARGENT